MKLTRIFPLLFILLLTSTSKAETPLVIESLWFVANHDYLTEVLSGMYGHDKHTLEFPEEIKSDAAWAGATITDGKEIWTIIGLPLNENTSKDNPFSMLTNNASPLEGLGDFIIANKLRTNAVIAQMFPNGEFKMQRDLLKNSPMLYLVSPGISEADLNSRHLGFHWDTLERKSHCAFMQNYPERTLLPTLPPEQEDESTFIKKVRQRSADNYRAGHYVGTADSDLVGLNFAYQGITFVWERVNAEETHMDSDTEPLPFQFGGFVNPDAEMGAALRVEREHLEKSHFGLRLEMTTIPPEEREDEKKYRFSLILTISSSEPKDDEDWHLLKGTHNTYVCYRKQPEVRQEEEAALSNEEFDKINESFARTILETGDKIFQSLLSLKWSQPMDFACSNGDETVYFACSSLLAKSAIDWNLAEQLTKTWDDYCQQIDPESPQLESVLMGDWSIKTIGEPIADGEITWHRMLVSGLRIHPIIVGYGPDNMYAAITRFANDLDEVSDELCEEQFTALQQGLVQRINVSRQAISDKMPPPKTVLHAKAEGSATRLDYETFGHGFRFTLHAEQDSIGTALAVIASYSSDWLNQALPFLTIKNLR